MILIDGIIFSLQRQGGISVYFRQLLQQMQRDGVPTTLLLDGTLQQAAPLGGDALVVIARSARLLERYRRCRIPQAVKPTLFHSSYYRQPAERSLPMVVTVHDFIYERFSTGPRRWVHMVQKHAAIRAAQAVICISESTRQDFLQWVGETPGQQVHVIHNGVADIFRPLELEPAPIPYVLYVGERGGYKNFSLVLKAMALLPELELHCVGGGALRPEELAVVDANVRRRVKHLGFVTEPELNEHYNRAVCLAYPSSYEGFGIPVLEAMRAGCPVVSADCKAVLEVGRDALIVSALDPASLADAILRTTSSGRPHQVQKGLSIAQEYSWEATHRQTLKIYQNLGAELGSLLSDAQG